MALVDLERIETLDAALADAALIAGDSPALRTPAGGHSFRTLHARSHQVARALAVANAVPGRQVGFLGPNGCASVELMFGAFRAGAIWTPLNHRLSALVLGQQVARTDMALCFAGAAARDIACGLRNRRGEAVRCVVIDGPGDDYPRFLEQGASAALPPAPRGEHVAAQISTSGTSGVPKGVLLTHDALLASRRMERAVGAPWALWEAGDINLVCMPNFHVSGALSVVSGIVNLGCTHLLPQFEVGAVLEVLERTPPARLLLVPSAIKALLDDPRSARVDFSRIRFVMYGGSPMPLPLMQEIQSRIACEFVQFYGMTETAGRATFLAPQDHVPGSRRMASAGRPFPGVRIAIRDETGAALPVGRVGEICISSASTMRGYWEQPAETAQVLTADGYRTGDVGYLDEDGYLFVVDRLNDKIVTGGENVYPSEVEGALRAHPGVADAAVCALPDPRWIEAIHAAVVLREGVTVGEKELRDAVAERIGAYKAPKRIVFVEQLPLGATGKVLRRDVVALVTSRLSRQDAPTQSHK